jgi:hypothetical protein
MSKEDYDYFLKNIEKNEEKYSRAAEKCEDRMVYEGISTVLDINRFGLGVFDICVIDVHEGRAKFEECSEIHSKIFNVAWENIKKIIEDLKKCGCRFE